MGMFDTVRSSYNLGPGYSKDLQTKDLDCLMTEYWIDPKGNLYEIDYSHTQDFTYDFSHYRWNGTNGKVRPVYFSGSVEVYPAKWDCYYAPFPSCFIHFNSGTITKVTHNDKRQRTL